MSVLQRVTRCEACDKEIHFDYDDFTYDRYGSVFCDECAEFAEPPCEDDQKPDRWDNYGYEGSRWGEQEGYGDDY